MIELFAVLGQASAIIAAVASLVAAVTATVAALHGWHNARAIQRIHIEINSRLTQLLLLTAEASRAQGALDAKASERTP